MLSLRRLFMIGVVAMVVYYVYINYGLSFLAQKANPEFKKSTDNVLGVANGIFAEHASKSADIVGGMVLKTATEPLMREYQKLRPSQKEIIKKQICK